MDKKRWIIIFNNKLTIINVKAMKEQKEISM